MKKLMMAFAALMVAISSQAALCDWKYSDSGKSYLDFKDHSILAFDYGDYDAVTGILKDGGATVATDLAAYYQSPAATITGNRPAAGDTATSLDSSKMFFIILNSTVADGNTYAISSAIDASGMIYEPGASKPGTLTFSGDKFDSLTSNTIGNNVPEPTSAMLFLLGIAGLALRRKQK